MAVSRTGPSTGGPKVRATATAIGPSFQPIFCQVALTTTLTTTHRQSLPLARITLLATCSTVSTTVHMLLVSTKDCPYGGHAGYVYLDGFGGIIPPPTTPEPG